MSMRNPQNERYTVEREGRSQASYRLGQAGLQGGRLGAHDEQAQAEERQAACHG